jgi:hypothetical protein
MYTRGQSLLDTALLRQSEAGKRAIRSAAQQASTAARTTEAAIGGAKEQAAATQKSLEKEKADVAKKTAEKLEGVEKEGGESAEQFANDINRFNTLMGGQKTTDAEGNTIYKDASGNILEVTDRDRELMSNPEQFGLQAQDIELDQGSDVFRSILGQIAGQGAFDYQTGMRRYTPEQEAMARNLALFKGETPKEYKPFETDVFKTSGQNIADKSQAYRAMQEDRQNQLNDFVSSINRGYTTPLIDPNKDVLPQLEKLKNQYKGQINKIQQDQAFSGGGFASEYGAALDGAYYQLRQLEQKENEYKNLMQNRQTTSLKDYLAKLYGIQTSPGEEGRGPSGRQGPIAQI